MAVYGSIQELELEVQSLKPRSTYKLAIDGVPVQGVTATSDSMGSILLTLSNSPAVGDFELPVQFEPITAIGHVELQDERGRVVLDGDYTPVYTGYCPMEQRVDK